ncbi:MAG TPA: phosphatidylserine decarboxylase family protein [Candidatus Xenobia bacterium]|nr:phosphatidylserine decarboxylase family protein [Candidatus Xenobia bacterium]
MIRTGYVFASVPALLGALLLWLGWWIPAGVLLALAAFILFFFRDPERQIPAATGAIVSPADGRVLAVDQVVPGGRPLTRISIFLSLFDVHVNRAPIAGRIAEVLYRPGKFHIASQPQASWENEQNEVVMEGEGTRVVFRQIAGLLARRIEFWKKTGDELARGERLGMIRFGSRVEVFFEPRYRVRVQPGEHVRGGSTILAQLE